MWSCRLHCSSMSGLWLPQLPTQSSMGQPSGTCSSMGPQVSGAIINPSAFCSTPCLSDLAHDIMYQVVMLAFLYWRSAYDACHCHMCKTPRRASLAVCTVNHVDDVSRLCLDVPESTSHALSHRTHSRLNSIPPLLVLKSHRRPAITHVSAVSYLLCSSMAQAGCCRPDHLLIHNRPFALFGTTCTGFGP